MNLKVRKIVSQNRESSHNHCQKRNKKRKGLKTKKVVGQGCYLMLIKVRVMIQKDNIVRNRTNKINLNSLKSKNSSQKRRRRKQRKKR